MRKHTIQLSDETEKFKIENRILLQKLNEAQEYLDAINTENIDALVIAHEKTLNIYIEKTANKPYRLIIENMHEGAVLLNEDGTILYCNLSFASMVNLPLHKIPGSLFEKYLDDSLKEHFIVLLNQGEVNVFKEEGYIYADGGKVIPILMTLRALALDNSFVLSIILTDLTIQYENQERLKVKAKLIEEKNNELENANIELAFQIEEKEKRDAELAIANKELALAAELAIANKELAFQIQEKDRHAAELMIVNQELAFQIEETKRRDTQLDIAKIDVNELEGLNIHKENLLATIAHDLRSPLAGIIQLSELLKDDFKTMEVSDLQNLLDHLHKLTTDELSMLDYLVEWARIKYAAEAFTPENIELSKCVTKVFNTLNEMAVAKKIHLDNEITEEVMVYADKKMLHSIFQNIIANGIKHTNEGGKITVSAKRQADKVIVEIKDTGKGMSKEVVDKLFEPQMKALVNERKINKGAGIGLLLIKGFVDKNGGEIWVDSTVGVGTSFYFTLPAEKPLD